MTKLEIHPDVIWGRPAAEGEDPLGWLSGCFEDVRTLVVRAAEAADGLIIDIS